MTRSIRGSRRAAVLLTGMAAVASMLVSGCGAGQIAETAAMAPTSFGINVQTADNLFKVRNLYVTYPGTQGYPADGNAPLGMVIYNDTAEPVTVTVTTDSARSIVLTSPTASASPSASASASPSGSPSASPSGSATPSPTATPEAPAGAPARIEIPAMGFAQLNPEHGNFLQLIGLNQALKAGNSVNLVFDFGGKARIQTPAPVMVPLTPAPPASPVVPGGEKAGEGTSHS